MLPDGQLLSDLRNSNEPIAYILKAAPRMITDENPAGATVAAVQAVKNYAIERGWNWAKVTGDLVLLDLLIARNVFEETLLELGGDSASKTIH
jgi:hypothetical protein